MLFWVAAGLLLYSYVGYPLLLLLLCRLRADPALPTRASPRHRVDWPDVAVVFAAHNEQVHIRARIENLRAQRYGSARLHIYVGSDGSSDLTVDFLEEMAGPDLSVFAYAQRRGKASVLNDVMAVVNEPIVVFTDANVEFEPDAVAFLVDALEAREAGAVCGELLLQDSTGDNQDALYWRLERFLKESEGKLGALLGANGAIYAIRRELYRPLREDTIIDDFVIAMRVAAEGRTLVYAPEARAREDTPERIEDEFRRRVRIGVGNYQALFRHPEFLFRAGRMRSFAYFSHKVLRWLGPHLLIVMLLACWWARAEVVYRALLTLQLGAYGVLLLAYGVRRWIGLPRLLSGLLMLMLLNLAFLLAFARFLGGDMRGQWSRTERRPSA